MGESDNFVEWFFEEIHVREAVDSNNWAVLESLSKMIQRMRKLVNGLTLDYEKVKLRKAERDILILLKFICLNSVSRFCSM